MKPTDDMTGQPSLEVEQARALSLDALRNLQMEIDTIHAGMQSMSAFFSQLERIRDGMQRLTLHLESFRQKSLMLMPSVKRGRNLRQDWAGALKDYREQFTALGLQKKALEGRGD